MRLDDAFDGIRRAWWALGQALADGDGAELAYATTCAGYGSDLGLMMAWARLTAELAGGDGRCLVICDDPWVFRHLAGLAGVEAGRPPPLWPRRLWLAIRGWLARLSLIPRLSLAALLLKGQRSTHRRGDRVLLVYGHPGSTAAGADAYFGPMMREMPLLKRLLHTDCPVGRARELGADGRTASLHAWGSPWKTPLILGARWRPAPRHLTGEWAWLVRRAAELEGGGGAHPMNRWQHMCHAAWLEAVQPAVVAWPWENHGWERAFARTARERGVRTVGYQHTAVGPDQLNYSPATNRDGVNSLPDLVVSDGPAYRDQLVSWGVPAERLRDGGSLRICRPAAVAYDPSGPVFVALSARPDIARHQLDALRTAAGRGFRFLVKEHPMYPVTIADGDGVRRTERGLAEQPALSACVYSTGTSGLEALIAGLPTYRLLPEDAIAVDILPGFVSARTVTAEGLADALADGETPAPLDWDDVLSDPDWHLWRSLLLGDGRDAPEAA